MFFAKKRQLQKKRQAFIDALNDFYLPEKATYRELEDFYDKLFNVIEKYADIHESLHNDDRFLFKQKLNVLIDNYFNTMENINRIYIQLLESKELDLESKNKIAKFARKNLEISNKIVSILDKTVTALIKEIQIG